MDRARKITWVDNTKVYICVSILSLPMERYKSKDISIMTRAINKWTTLHESFWWAHFHHIHIFFLEVLFCLQKSKVTLDRVHHCKVCCALKYIYGFLRLFSILAHSFVAIELLACFKHTKFHFYFSRELLLFGLEQQIHTLIGLIFWFLCI